MSRMRAFSITMFVFCAVIAGAIAAVVLLSPKPESYKVEFYGEPEVIAYLSGSGVYNKGDEVTLTARDREGYVFGNWLKDDNIVSQDQVYTFTMDETTRGKYTATYEAIDYTITAPQQNGSFNITQGANIGDRIEITDVVANEGYEFKEMYYTVQDSQDKVAIVDNVFIMPAANITVHVDFAAIEYTITYNIDDDAVIDQLVESYTIETDTFYLPIPIRHGYIFEGWTGTDLQQALVSVTIAKGSIGDREYTANWTPQTYTISTSIVGEGSLSVQSTALYTDEVTLTYTADEGNLLTALYYVLQGDDEQFNIDTTFTMPAGNITIYAIFDQVTYTISKDPGTTYGYITLSRLGANMGDAVTVTVTTDPGHQVSRTYYIVEGTNTQVDFEYEFIMPAGNVTVYAVIEVINYTINYELYGGQLPDDAWTTYCVFDEYTLPIPTREGSFFNGWHDNENFYGEAIKTIPVNSTGDKTFYANWSLDNYPITFVDEDGTILQQFYIEYGQVPVYGGETPIKLSTVQYNYTFAGWQPALYAANQAQTYTAQYTAEERKYTVIFNSNGGTSVSAEQYTYGETLDNLSTKVSTREGYNFLGWFTAATGGMEVSSTTQVLTDVTYYARWSAKTYSITLNLDGGSVTGNNPITYTIQDNDFTLPTPTKTGYTFLGWVLNDGDTPNTTVTIAKGSTGDKTYTATWQINTFTIVWKNYDGTILETDADVEYNTMPVFNSTTPTKPADAEYSYTFSGWTPTVVVATDNAEYTATYTSTTMAYTVNFDSTGGSTVASVSKNYGDTIGTLPTPTRDGYTLYGWFTQATGGTQVTADYTITQSTTLYARWDLVTYSITYNLDGGTLDNPINSYNTESVTFTLPTPTKTGHTFAGWTGTGLSEATTTVTIAKGSLGHREYTATWVKVDYDIYVIDSPYGTIEPSKTIATIGEVISVTITPNTGYEVVRQYYVPFSNSSEQFEFDGSFTMPADNVEIYVEFAKIDYTITKSAASNGSYTISKTTANYGDTITLTTTADENYRLAEMYYLDSDSVKTVIADNTFTMPASNVTVYVVFEGPYYTMTVAQDPTYPITITIMTQDGEVVAQQGDAIDIIAGTSLKFTVSTTDPGLVLSENALYCSTELNSTRIESAFMMPEDNITLSAIYDLASFNITVDSTEGGSYECNSTATYQSTVTITATPDPGYKLAKLYYVCDNDDQATQHEFTSTFTMPADNVTIYVIFEQEFTAFSNDVTLGTVAQSGTFAVGNSVSVAATIIDTNAFLGWKTSLDATTYVSTDEEYTFTVTSTSPKHYYAIFVIATSETTVADYTYTFNNSTKTATVKSYNNTTATSATVPQTVEYQGLTYTVDIIGERAFYEKTNLQSVSLPNTIVELQSYVFFRCKNLASINLPEGLTNIGIQAFFYCEALTTITIPASLIDLSSTAFNGCSSIEEIIVASGNTTYDSRDNCNAVIRTASDELIVGCQNTVIPDSVRGIGSCAFGNQSKLVNINIPEGVQSIGYEAFNGCYSLTSVYIPASVTYINDYNPFVACSSIAIITVAEGNTVYDSREDCNAIIETKTNTLIAGCQNTVIPNDVVKIGGYAFYRQSVLGEILIPLEEIVIPASVAEIGDYAFYVSNIKNVYVESSIIATALSEETACGYLLNNTTSVYVSSDIDSSLNAYVKTNYTYQYEGIVVDGKVYNLYSKNEHTDLEYYVTVESNDVTLGTAAYSGTFVVGNEITLAATPLDENTFLGWKANLEDTTYLSTDEEYTFTFTSASSKTYYAVFFDAVSDATIGDYTYTLNHLTNTATVKSFNNETATSTTVPQTVSYNSDTYTVSEIGTTAFYYKSELESVSLPSTIIKIGSSSFGSTWNLSSINLPEGLTFIDGGAFRQAGRDTSLEVTLPSSLTNIGVDSFYESGLTDIIIPKNVTFIDYGAFSACAQLTSITVDTENQIYEDRGLNAIVEKDTDRLIAACSTTIFDNSIEIIGQFSCSGLKIDNLILPSSIKEVEWNAFFRAKIKTITLNEGLLTIGNQCFSYNESLTTINIPSTVTSYYVDFVRECPALESIYIANSKFYEEFTYTFYSSQLYWLVDTTIFENLDNIYVLASVDDGSNTYLSDTANYAYQYKDVAIDGKVYNLYSKNEHTDLEYYVTVESNDVTLGTAAYSGTFVVGNEITLVATAIDTNIFLGWKTSLDAITYVSTDEEYTFTVTSTSPKHYYAIFVIATSETTVADYTYTFNNSTKTATVKTYNNTTATSATVPQTVEYQGLTYTVDIIGESAFASKTNLQSITLPNSIVKLQFQAFYNTGKSGNLTITLPDSLETIEPWAFRKSSISSITIPKNVKLIGNTSSSPPSIFFGCTYLTEIKVSSENTKFEDRGLNAIIEKTTNEIVSACNTTVIDDTITSIGAGAFFGLDITSVTLPSTITSIGYQAFYNCQKLVSIELNEGLEYIGNNAFARTALTEIVIPSTVSTLYKLFMDSSTELKTIYMDSSTIYPIFDDTNYSSGGCFTILENIYILSSIDDGSNTYLSDTANYAYQYKNVSVDGVSYNLYSKVEHTDLEYVATIELYTSDEELGSVNYTGTFATGNTVTLEAAGINQGTFYGWAIDSIEGGIVSKESTYQFTVTEESPSTYYALFHAGGYQTGVTVDGWTYNIYYLVNRAEITGYTDSGMDTDITFPDTVTYSGTTYIVDTCMSDIFGDSGFSGIATIGKNLTVFKNPFRYGIGGFSVSADNPVLKTDSSGSAIYSKDETILYAGADSFTNIEYNIKKVAPYALCSYSGESKSVSIPNSVEYIGDYAFYGIAVDFTCGDSLVYIGEYAFASGINSTIDLSKASEFLVIDSYAFSRCEMDSFVFPTYVERVGGNIFQEIYFAEFYCIWDLSVVDDSAFADISGIGSLYIENNQWFAAMDDGLCGMLVICSPEVINVHEDAYMGQESDYLNMNYVFATKPDVYDIYNKL